MGSGPLVLGEARFALALADLSICGCFSMTRPAIEVADIVCALGNRFLERYQSSFSYQQLKAFRAIPRCRTAAERRAVRRARGL